MSVGFSEALLLLGAMLAAAALLSGWLRASVLSVSVLAVVAGLFLAGVDVVTVDYVADAILALAGRPGTTRHLTASDRASTVGELIELGSAAAAQPRPRVIPPRLYRRLVHPVLVRQGSEARRRALRRSEVYFPYFAMRTRYDNSKARDALEPLGIGVPPLATYFNRLLAFAMAAEWGRRPIARHEVVGPPPVRPRPASEPLAA